MRCCGSHNWSEKKKQGALNFDSTFRAIIGCDIPNTPNPCYTTFCFNAPHRFTLLLYLRPFLFGLTHFGWFIPVCLFLMGVYFFFIYAHFFMNATRALKKYWRVIQIIPGKRRHDTGFLCHGKVGKNLRQEK